MELNFEKGNGLIPAIIQDADTGRVLMLGYMNEESFRLTERNRRVTFYSRSRGKIWEKGETSGNTLHLVEMVADCDQDTLLIKARPEGPVCHTGADTCFSEENKATGSFLFELEKIIAGRKGADPAESYTARLYSEGIRKIAQKVGEEAVESILEAVTENDERLLEETADLLYHLLVLLNARNVSLADVTTVLEKRHNR